MNRRDFNRQWQRAALAYALTPWMQALAEPVARTRRWHDNPFALGVASGRPRSDSVVLWTRLLVSDADRQSANDAMQVHVEVFADPAMKQRVHSTTQVTDARNRYPAP